MVKIFTSFASLYFAILLLSLGTGLYNTYVSLRLTQDGVSQSWIGLLISAYYFGLVIGVRVGHKLIGHFGHIRAYVASAAIVTVMTLTQSLVHMMEVWLLFRVIVGIAMVTQYMVLESWLNDQAEANNRGMVFSFYMIMSSLGIILGQMAISAFPNLDISVLNTVAMVMSLGLIPIALTHRVHPTLQSQAPLNIRVYLKMVPVPMVVLMLGGCITSAFYSLAAVYGAKNSLDTEQVSILLSACVLTGLLAQSPMGYLSDRFNRLRMLRVSSFGLMLATIPLILLGQPSYLFLLITFACMGCLQFTFYPLAVALANEHVSQSLRVGLSGVLLLAFSIGATLGPIIAGRLMDIGGAEMYIVYVATCALVMGVFVSKMHANYRPNIENAQFVPMGVDISPAPVVHELDPRVNVEQDVSTDPAVMDQVKDLVLNADAPVSPIVPNLLVDEEDFKWEKQDEVNHKNSDDDKVQDRKNSNEDKVQDHKNSDDDKVQEG
ncbi:MFS transporter [Pelistega europaea]|uniref:MFS transporter n=1 Tax=Pelistega europaea TaxID=106147 RepID=A0A7Y4LAI8_9BURK|nr:MFS transporter [Pelistega europaea]NOL49985.1 MFS transporter [Pelistega europaea]